MILSKKQSKILIFTTLKELAGVPKDPTLPENLNTDSPKQITRSNHNRSSLLLKITLLGLSKVVNKMRS